MAAKTGLVAVVIALEGICRTIRAYRPKMNDAVAAAELSSLITHAQAVNIYTFLDITQAACDALRLVTGY